MKTNRIVFMVVTVALAMAMLAGCATPPAPSATATAAPTTAPAEAPLSGKITVAGSTSVGPFMDELTKMFTAKNPGVTIDVQQVGSGQGIALTMDGTADIGMSSRELKDSEKPLNEYLLCMDGIAVVVHPDNAVPNLTKDQVKGIYMGEIKNWKEVGGADANIDVYTRESTSGTRGAFEELVLGKDAAGKQVTIDDTICAAVLNSGGDIGAGVQMNKNSIGYITMGVVGEYKIKAVQYNGVDANTDNVKNKTYALQRPFLLLSKSEPTGAVKALLDFCLTDAEAIKYLESKHLIIAK